MGFTSRDVLVAFPLVMCFGSILLIIGMKIYDYFVPPSSMVHYSNTGYVLFLVLLSWAVFTGWWFLMKSIREKQHWVFKLRIILGMWLIVGAMLHIVLGYNSVDIENMFYVGLGSWISFIVVFAVSKFLPPDPPKLPQKYDSHGKRSFSYESGFGVFKNSTFDMAVSDKKKFQYDNIAKSIKNTTRQDILIYVSIAGLWVSPILFFVYYEHLEDLYGWIPVASIAVFLWVGPSLILYFYERHKKKTYD